MIVYLCLGWYLGLFIAFIGWGAIWARYVAKDDDVDVGLLAGWGVAAVLSLGGFLLAAKIATAKVLLLLIVMGQAAAFYEVWRKRAACVAWVDARIANAKDRPWTFVMAALIVMIAMGRIVAMSFRTGDTFRADDDSVAYAFYPKQIAELGTTLQPFSHRHSQAMNGQAFLEALAVPAVKIQHAFGLDAGLFVLIAIALVAGVSKKPWLERSPLEMLPELALSVLLGTHINLNSQFTGVVVFLTLFRTLSRPTERANESRSAVTVGICTLAACVLKPTNLPAAGVMLGLSYGLPLFRQNETPTREKLRLLLTMSAVTAILLAPWLFTSYRSDATPFYPFIQGNATHVVLPLRKLDFNTKALVWGLFDDSGLRTLLCLAFAGICIRQPSRRNARAGLIVGAFITWFIFVLIFPGGWREHVPRLLFPTFIAMSFAIAAEAMANLPLDEDETFQFGRIVPAILVTLALVVNMHEQREALTRELQEDVDFIEQAGDKAVEYAARERLYAQMQSSTKAGEGIMVLAVDGYLFDSSRNPIYTPDHPGLAGPSPGWPAHATDDGAVRYFLDHGVRYIAVSTERPDPFDTHMWGTRVGSARPLDPANWPQAFWAPYISEALQLIDRVVAHRKPVFKGNSFAIVDLAAPTE